MTQGSLFDTSAPEPHRFGAFGRRSEVIPPRDPGVTDDDERGRLSRQCLDIIDRLRKGPATNRELAGISIKYSGRVSDARAAGYDIRCISQCRKTGLSVYQLFEAEPPR